MKKKIIIGIIAIILIASLGGMIYAGVTLKGKEISEDKHLIEISYDELQTKISNKESFILVITKTDCTHCAEYKPVLKEVLTEYDLYAYYIEKDKLNNTQLSGLNEIASISGTPTTIFITDGEEQSTSTRLVGTKTKSKIIDRLKALGYIEE